MKRSRSLGWLTCAAVLFACAPDGPSLHTTAADDARVIDQITGVWTADDGTELLLCERSEAAVGGASTGCEASHVIRSGSAAHDEDVVLDRKGCGGMCFDIAAFVGGWLHRPGKPDLYVAGDLVTAKSDAQTAYQMPYRLLVGQYASNAATELDAQMNTADRLDAAQLKVGDPRTPVTATGPAFTLKKTASAAGRCPPPDQAPKNITDLDAGSDAQSDAGPGDAGGDGGTCTRGAPSVACDKITCTASTPVCCEKDGVTRCVADSCPTFSDADPTPYGVNEVHCDDGADCPAGEFCCATYDKGLSRSISACTKTACSTPLCASDCDCPSGQTCSVGLCH